MLLYQLAQLDETVQPQELSRKISDRSCFHGLQSVSEAPAIGKENKQICMILLQLAQGEGKEYDNVLRIFEDYAEN